jgi:beta-glucuronidase
VWTFAAAQTLARVGGINRKGIFTRIRTLRPAAHVLRELWVW